MAWKLTRSCMYCGSVYYVLSRDNEYKDIVWPATGELCIFCLSECIPFYETAFCGDAHHEGSDHMSFSPCKGDVFHVSVN